MANTRIAGNVIRRNGSAGISNVNHTDGTILGNTIEANGLTNEFGSGIGVPLRIGVARTVGTRMLIQGNEVHGNAWHGIEIAQAVNAGGNRILNNDAADNATKNLRVYDDLYDGVSACRTNEWSGNTWGSGGYNQACVTAGGSCPEPQPSALSAHPTGAAPNAPSIIRRIPSGPH